MFHIPLQSVLFACKSAAEHTGGGVAGEPLEATEPPQLCWLRGPEVSHLCGGQGRERIWPWVLYLMYSYGNKPLHFCA